MRKNAAKRKTQLRLNADERRQELFRRKLPSESVAARQCLSAIVSVTENKDIFFEHLASPSKAVYA